MAICQNCGYHWAVGENASRNSLVWIVVVAIILIASCLKTYSGDYREASGINNANEKAAVWATEYTPLSEFDYYIDDDGIRGLTLVHHSRGTRS